MRSLILSAIAAIFTVSASNAEEIRVLSWSVESNLNDQVTNDPVVIAQQLTALQPDVGPYDLIALTEVRANGAGNYELAVEDGHGDYHAFTSSTGGSDRLMLLVRSDRFPFRNRRR